MRDNDLRTSAPCHQRITPKLMRLLTAVALLAVICGCSMTNRATAVQETTLTLQGPTTRAAEPCSFQLVRVEPDGTVVLRPISSSQNPERTISGKPGQVIGLIQTSDTQWRVIIVSSDPVLQQATIRGEISKQVSPAFW